MRPHSYKGLLSVAIKKRINELRDQNPNLPAQAATDQAKKEMLAHCPLNPPRDGKCAINSLSDKLLVHIFELAWKMELEERIFGKEKFNASLLKDSSGEGEKGGSGGGNVVGDGIKTDDEDDDEAMPVDPPTHTPTTKQEIVTPVNITHVCSRWRRVAINTPSLWTHISFEKCISIEQHKTFLERAKSSLIDIKIDVVHESTCGVRKPFPWQRELAPDEEFDIHYWQCQGLEIELVQCLLRTVDPDDPTLPTLLGRVDWYAGSYIHELEDSPDECECCDCLYTLSEFSEILDLLISRLQSWRTLEVMVNDYRWMYLLLARLHQCEPPNNLEELRLIRSERRNPVSEYSFMPPRLAANFAPFRGIMPKLKRYYFNGVHIDWDACASVLGNVKMGRLVDHNEEVRPSFPTFAKMVQPLKGRFSLRNSGPKGNENHWRAIGMTPVVVPWLRRLALYDLKRDYAASLLRFLDMPNLTSLTLDLDTPNIRSLILGLNSDTNSLNADEFVDVLCDTSRLGSKSLLGGLEHFDTALDCRKDLMIRMLEQLWNLKTLDLGSDIGKVSILDPLCDCKPSTPGRRAYCPLLESVNTGNRAAEEILDIVEARANAGVPLKRVNLYCDERMVEPEVEEDLKGLLEKFEYGPFEVDEEE